MFGKSVYLLAFLVTIAVAAIAAPLDHDTSIEERRQNHLIAGKRLPGDRLILKQVVEKSASWDQIITVEQVFSVKNNQKITELRALDQNTNGTGATARILSGGPGTSTVTLGFRSIKGQNINFTVELYAI